MQSILNFQLLIPISLLVLQTFILLFIEVAVLRRFKILKLPYAGMEYSNLIIVAILLFGVFFISTADIGALFQSFKTFQNARENIFSNTFYKFSQFFLVIFFFQILFALISFFIIRLLLGFKNSIKELEEGNIPGSILMAVIILSFAIIFQFCAKEVIEYITPQYLNFR
jgi:hypothetical protein